MMLEGLRPTSGVHCTYNRPGGLHKRCVPRAPPAGLRRRADASVMKSGTRRMLSVVAHAPLSNNTPAAGPLAPSKCPFASLADFIIKEDDKRPPRLTPLGKAIFSTPPATGSAVLWLKHGSPGQDTPGKLVTGLRRLTHAEEFLQGCGATETSDGSYELGRKKAAYDTRREGADAVFVAEERSLDGQTECLELFLDYLPKRFPELYRVEGEGAARVVHVALTGEAHRVADYAARPLELCGRIAQEDLCLVRSLAPDEGREDDPSGNQHVMTAAAVVFSFADLAGKLGKPLKMIHAPVPGYERDMAKLLNRTFSAIDPAEPLWRNNWGIFDSGDLEPSYGTADLLEKAQKYMPAEERWLKVEYETLRRLPRSGTILFTIKGFASPLSDLAQVPNAAACLMHSLEGMSQPMRTYKGVPDLQQQAEMMDYLKEMSRVADGPAGPTFVPGKSGISAVAR